MAPGGTVNINAAQLNLKTSTTGKTIDTSKFSSATVKNGNTLVLTFSENVFDKGLSYKVDMPIENIIKNGIFTNAMNEATSGLTARAQENVSIASMKAQIVADPKNDAKADLILTFDQVPNLASLDNSDIVLFDGRDKYILSDSAIVKVYGGDTTGKSIVVEDISKYEHATKGALVVRGDKTYDVEIDTEELSTDSFDNAAPAKNKSKLKASTKGISVAQPVVDEVRLQSADKIEIEFKEDIKGNVAASSLTLKAYVANRWDIFNNPSLVTVSGSGYYDVKISGKVMTITAKTGVKFPTSLAATDITIDEKSFTNASGKVGNEQIKINDFNFNCRFR